VSHRRAPSLAVRFEATEACPWINGCLKNEAAYTLQADVDEDGIINYEEFCQVGFKI
jgi:hypothetical protein